MRPPDSPSPAGRASAVESVVEMDESTAAPVHVGQKLGTVKFMLDGEEIGQCDVTAAEDVAKIGYFGVMYRVLCSFLLQ